VLGSPSYLAPERLDDLEAGPESDLWSLGVTLYAAVEGKSPWQRSSAYATVAALVQREPLPPPVHAGPLTPVLAGLLAWDPADRLDADRASEMLRQVLAGTTPAPVVPPAAAEPRHEPKPEPEPEPRTKKGRWLVVGSLAAAIVLAGVAVGLGLVESRPGGGDPAGPLAAFPATAGASENVAGYAPVEPSPAVSPTVSRPKPAGTGVVTRSPRLSTPPTRKPAKATPKATAKAPLTPVADSRPLVNRSSGRCIDVPDGNPDTTAEIQLWDCQNGVGQAFTLTGDGLWHVVGKCLEMSTTGKGAHLYLGTCTGGSLQKFALTGSGTLVGAENGYCVEPSGGVVENGTWLRTYTCNGSAYQQWQLS
jgi:hypothetical protein